MKPETLSFWLPCGVLQECEKALVCGSQGFFLSTKSAQTADRSGQDGSGVQHDPRLRLEVCLRLLA